MKFENSIENIDEKRSDDDQKDESERGMTRRELLKKGTLVAAGVGMFGVSEFIKLKDKAEEKHSGEEDLEVCEEKFVPIKKEEAGVEIMTFKKDRDIELTLETAEILEDKWAEEYKNNHRHRDSLIPAYYEMGKWEKEIECIFIEVFDKLLKEGRVDAETVKMFSRLAIPESYCQYYAKSEAEAVGWYQFTKSTAEEYGLHTGRGKKYKFKHIDERCDPLKSAKAAAKFMRDLYVRSHYDADLAVSGYNGGYFNSFRRYAKREGLKINYGNYLEYLAIKANKIKKACEGDSFYSYKVERTIELGRIASMFGTSVERICKENKFKKSGNEKIKKGTEISIPLDDNREIVFRYRARDIEENLNHPAKLKAINELIEGGFVKDQKDSLDYKTIKVREERQYATHIFKKEEKNIFQVAKKYKNVSYLDILVANPEIKPKELKGGEELLIPTAGSVGLNDLSKKYKVPIDKLQEYNPDILDKNKCLPDWYEMRIPA